jgi:hypothetical protein
MASLMIRNLPALIFLHLLHGVLQAHRLFLERQLDIVLSYPVAIIKQRQSDCIFRKRRHDARRRRPGGIADDGLDINRIIGLTLFK